MGSVIAPGAGESAVKNPVRGGIRSEEVVCGGEIVVCTDVAELDCCVTDGRLARAASRSGMMKSVKPGIGGSRAKLAMGEFAVKSPEKGGTRSGPVAWDDDGAVASGT